MTRPSTRRIAASALTVAVALGATVLTAAPASAVEASRVSTSSTNGHGSTSGYGSTNGFGGWHGGSDASLTPRTRFTMAPDGSSGATQGGEGIPNIDSVKKTIATYYGDPGTGIANKTSSPYISEMTKIVAGLTAALPAQYAEAKAKSPDKIPAIVLDTDDTMLMTYDREVATMHFNFDPAQNNTDVLNKVFPATPAMKDFENYARSLGFEVIGITGRSAAQKQASIENVTEQGYTGFTADNYYTKWAAGAQPDYITCAVATACTTVEYKALTRKHLDDTGYDVVLNVGDQWSDLQGGFADHIQKLPNPTYYLPSADLPGVSEPALAARTAFTMKADGTSGATESGEGIPNIDSVKKTIATYYGDPGTGIANKTASPYITEMRGIVQRQIPAIALSCFIQKKLHQKPAVVLDADDTTLWTYDMEVADMHFNFNPAEQDVWVQDQRFPATPSMVSAVSLLQKAGCTIVGLTGRNDDQKAATIANLAKVGYTGFTAANYYTKWTGVGASQQPSYIHCATAKCTTIEYKSQTRAHVQTRAGGGYRIVANFGDQFSDLIGGSSQQSIKLPNPTYYLP